MEVLSPRSANVPMKHRSEMKKTKEERKPKPDEKPSNPDRIDDKWRPPSSVTEPGTDGETYVVGRKLGNGGFAVCFEGMSRKDSKKYALKVVKAKVEQKKMMEKFRTELQIHAKMQHPNIVEFLRAFTHENHTYVILELCSNGNLTDMVKARGCLSLPEVRRFMIQICGGVRYMHKRSVIHRDLKMGNIFLDGQMKLQIGDFGLAAVMADEHDRRTTLCGTPNYIAPEILSKSASRGHDNKVDTWAVGVICYAMLVGTPPFQSKSQQEIYAKLRSLEYEWKIDCKNYIPQQAKDFVASCLNLVSAERPEMDDLVEHEFFTMGVVADELDSSTLRDKPSWLLEADPRGDRVKPGYGITHSQICRAAGVGRGVDGRLRPGVGGKTNISTLVEIEAENREGSAPVIPLPEGVLYTAFTEAHAEWAARQRYPIQPGKPRSKKPVAEHLAKIKTDDALVAQIPTMGPPPRPQASRVVPSFAAQQRQQALPARPAPGEKLAEEFKEVGEATTAPPSSEGLLKARPMRAASVRVTRSTSAQSTGGTTLTKTLPKSTTLPSLVEQDEPTRRRKLVRDEQKPPVTTSQIPRPNILMGDNATTRPRSAQSNDAENMATRALKPTSGNDRRPHIAKESKRLADDIPVKSTPLPLYEAPKQNSRVISPSSGRYTMLRSTTSSDILECLSKLEEALTPRPLSEWDTGSLKIRRMKARLPYPRVEKWVDYSSRHGISYILTDGTLGMIMKSAEDTLKPSSCIVVRNAQTHTVGRAKGTEHQYVPQGPNARDVEFYEQTDCSKPLKKMSVPSRKFYLDLQKYPSQTAAANATQSALKDGELERFKEVVLLDKFGKYMNKRYEDAEAEATEEAPTEPSEHFIHFYQRLGNVGVWRYADGGLQFNFPDHTKITIYQDQASRTPEYVVDLIHLDPEDARNLTTYGRLTSDSLERRGEMTIGLREVLTDALRASEMDVIKSNEVKEKLSWIRAVVGCWIKEGGLGRTGEEKLGWSGLQERRDDKKVKLQWVTVGRLGGDGDGVTSK